MDAGTLKPPSSLAVQDHGDPAPPESCPSGCGGYQAQLPAWRRL